MFPLPTLPNPSLQHPIKLNKLSARLGSTNPQKVRTVDEILEVIQQGYSESISPLEWIYCLHTKANWDKDHPEDACQISKSIWDVAIENPNLAYLLDSLLLYRLALYYSGDKTALSSSLAECFLAFAQRVRSTRSLKVDILEAISSATPSQALAKLSWQKLILPQQLLTQASLPSWILPAKETYIVHLFIESSAPSKEQVELLLSCLNSISLEQQIQNVNSLLAKIPTQVGSQLPKLVNWLKDHYRTGKLWASLSEHSKKALRDWIGAINYSDFQNLVELIQSKLYLEGWEENQLKKRKGFWTNYSTRFERLRILLPQKLIDAIGSHLKGSFESLVPDGSDSTEICIFDFGNWFVVEFFRGKGSETRLFEKNIESEKQLFGLNPLSVKKIRSLGGKTHDHVFCWQFYCERWLRQQEIYPDEGTQYFKGVPRNYSQYSPSTGLPNPSRSDQEQRNSKLSYWNRDLEQLERDARDYCGEN